MASTAEPTIEGIENLVLIGAGGFGAVYRGDQRGAGREVAVKVLDVPDPASTGRRLERECAALGAVSGHPNVVVVHEVLRAADGRPCIVMEHLDGGSLADRLRAVGPVPPPEVVAVGVKLCGALAAAHAAGILHRDVKPENVLVSRFGEPKLGDFGIATSRGDDSGDRPYVLGSFAHAAPEVLAGDPPTVAADVYSLASTLFTLLSGEPPFGGPQDGDYATFLRDRRSRSVPDLRPRGVPDGLCRALEQALATEPRQRPPSADELRRQLEKCAASGGFRPGAPGGRRRRARLAVPVAAVAVAATVIVALATQTGGHPASGGPTSTTSPARSATVSPTTVRLAPLPPGGEQVVFRDDFSTSSGWLEVDDERRTSAYTDGQYRVTTKAGTGTFTYGAPVQGFYRGSTRVEVDATKIQGDAASYGVLCAVELAGAYGAVIGSDGAWRVEHLGSGQPTRRFMGEADRPLGAGPTHISLECRLDGSKVILTLLVNGSQITKISTDTPMSSSGLSIRPGLVAGANGPEAVVLFDNFVLTVV